MSSFCTTVWSLQQAAHGSITCANFPGVWRSNGFDLFNPSTDTAEGTSASAPGDDTIPVDYGEDYKRITGVESVGQIKKAVLYGQLRSDWKWSNDNPVHFICHSQGGNTIRLLISLLKDRSSRPSNFGTAELEKAI